MGEGMEAKQKQKEFLVQTIAVGVRNDQMLEGIALQFKSLVSFGFGCNPRVFGGGSNLIKKAPHMKRLLSNVNTVEHRQQRIRPVESPIPARDVWTIQPGPRVWYQKVFLFLLFFVSLPSPPVGGKCRFVRAFWSRFEFICSVLQCVAVCCSVLQCVAVYLQCPFKRFEADLNLHHGHLEFNRRCLFVLHPLAQYKFHSNLNLSCKPWHNTLLCSVPYISAKELYFPAKKPYISLEIKLNCTQDTLLSCVEVLDRFLSKGLKFVVNVFSCERAHIQIYQANYVRWDLVVFCTCRTESLKARLNLS